MVDLCTVSFNSWLSVAQVALMAGGMAIRTSQMIPLFKSSQVRTAVVEIEGHLFLLAAQVEVVEGRLGIL